jgi:predicted MFS family arabinose efflux permease
MVRLYLLFASIYLLEGVSEVSFILNVYLKKILSFSPSQIGQILFLGGLWFIILKPLIGFVADYWKGFNDRLALIFGLFCSAAGWTVIAGAQSPLAMTVGVSLKVLAIAFLDVLIDGMIVKVSNSGNRSFIQSLVYGCRFGGAMIFSTWAGNKITQGAVAFVEIYYLLSVFSLLFLIPVLLYRRNYLAQEKSGENEVSEIPGRSEEKVSFKDKLTQLAHPSFGWLLVLLFLFALGVDTATFFEPVIEERFGGDFLGQITTIYYIGILAGILTFPMMRIKWGMKILFIISLLGWSLAEISCLGMATWNGAVIYFCGGFFNAYTSLTLLTVATAMCKIRGIETFAFAFAISIKNLMDQSKILFGGYVMEGMGLTWLFAISSLCGLLPFLVLNKIEFEEI